MTRCAKKNPGAKAGAVDLKASMNMTSKNFQAHISTLKARLK